MTEEAVNRTELIRRLDVLRTAQHRPAALIGFDGYIDKLVRPRRSQNTEDYFDTVAEFAQLLLTLGGTSSDIAVRCMFEKLGGNGPLLAEALAEKGVDCTCIGAMGQPELAAPYRQLEKKVRLVSVADCASSYALEFNNGKIMLGDADSFQNIGWKELQEKLGPSLPEMFRAAQLICFANWSGLPRSTELMEGIISDIGPLLDSRRRRIFFDLADPSAKSETQFAELFSALDRMRPFFYRVVGLNPKECLLIFNLFYGARETIFDPDMLSALLRDFPADEIVIHDAGCAYVGKTGQLPQKVKGRFLARPRISVGAGDNFNSGYCLGILCDLPPVACAMLGNVSAVCFMEQGKPANLEQLIASLEKETIS